MLLSISIQVPLGVLSLLHKSGKAPATEGAGQKHHK
jgi:hypothetical protein